MNADLYVSIKPEFLRPSEPRESRQRPAAVATAPAPAPAPAPAQVSSSETVPEHADISESKKSDMDVVENTKEASPEDNGASNPAVEGEAAGNKRKRDEQNDPQKAEFKKMSLKARHQHKNRPDKEDRLCPATVRGEPCPFGESCYYNHDLANFLSRKPADIAPRCYLFDTYGVCPQGFMCRFGDAHIDRVTLQNKTRPVEQGGVLPRYPELNALRKEVQVLLRKKNAYFDQLQKKRQAATSAVAPSTNLSDSSIPPSTTTTTTATTIAATTTMKTTTTTEVAPIEATSDAVVEHPTATTEVSPPPPPAPTSTIEATGDAASSESIPTVAAAVVVIPPKQDVLAKLHASVPTAFTASYTASILDSATDVSSPIHRILHENPYFNATPYPPKPVKLVDFRQKVYVAPLTTVGNLPFRRILKEYGADITCGEMAMAFNLQGGQASEWALLRRHVAEDVFGIQVAGNASDLMRRCAMYLEEETVSEFVDVNCGCPIDVVCNRGGGSALLTKPAKLIDILQSMAVQLPSRSLTVKVRTGWDDKHPTTHKLLPMLQQASLKPGQQPGGGVPLLSSKLACVFLHGRSRLQRYSKLANWSYIAQCARAQDPTASRILPVIGNGDLFCYQDWLGHRQDMIESAENLGSLAAMGLPPHDAAMKEAAGDFAEEWASDSNHSTLLGLTSCAMLARGALIKPWLPKEIKELREYDISASERMDMLQRFCNYGLDHWGSDSQGVQTTRRFLLEWLSFLHRYVPAGITSQAQRLNQRPPPYVGRGEIETTLSSASAEDWIKLSEYFLGPVPDNFHFQPKHKSNAYASESTSMGAGAAAAMTTSGAIEDVEASNG